MTEIFKGIEPMVYKSKISVPYHWWAGETASKFLVTLRDAQKIMGTKCAKCNRTYVPPRKNCPSCFGASMEWVELSHEGSVVTFTVARRQLASLPRKVPVIFALIKLDGADTAMMHYLDGVDPAKVNIGMRVKAKFSGSRGARMQDIECFIPKGE
ncbi:MAG TPA: Zn-ribbon domain-containing OB-fold protein [Spirochaetota bacterium]|nr:Zn-ribbon domain-containing OB-fold protein [Spirochaetota bacterium]